MSEARKWGSREPKEARSEKQGDEEEESPIPSFPLIYLRPLARRI